MDCDRRNTDSLSVAPVDGGRVAIAPGLSSLEFFRELCTNSPDSLVALELRDPPHDSPVVFANDAAARTLGWETDVLLTRTAGEIFDMSPEGLADWVMTMLTGEVISVEGRARRRDGTYFPIEARARAMSLEGRSLVVAAGRDISRQVQVQTEAQSVERRFRAAVEASLDALFLLESVRDEAGQIRDFRFVDLNARCEQMLGRPRAELIGRCFGEFYTVDKHTAFRLHCVAVVESGQPVEDEVQPLIPELPFEWLLRQIVPLGDGLMVTWRDISAAKRAARREQEQQAALAHAGRVALVGQMAGGIAHELGQPLFAIENNISALLRTVSGGKPLGETALQGLRAIAEGAERARKVIRRLTEFVRRAPVHRDEVDMNALLREAAEMAMLPQRYNKVHIHWRLDPELPTVHADRVLLQQVAVNLLHNACDALRGPDARGTAIDVATALVAGAVETTIADAGPGVPAEALASVFEPFFTTKSDGLGLGLAMCRWIVEDHDGRIWVESPPGQGARFHFTVPITSPARGRDDQPTNRVRGG